MSDLLKRLKKASYVDVYELSESQFIESVDSTSTSIYALNIALGGSIYGGFPSGLITLAGPSKHFKTLYALIMLKAYMDKYPEAICLFYDSEFGATKGYFESLDVDTDRVLHIPVVNIEEIKFDLVKKLDRDEGVIKKGDRVFVLVDSIGNLASKKEIEDAKDEKSVADMTRAKQLKSFFRMITPFLTILDIPMVCIAHVYDSMDKYTPDKISGGNGPIYASNIIIRVAKNKIKGEDKKTVAGYDFDVIIEKSRFVREGTRLPISVEFDKGVSPFTGLFDIAREVGTINMPVSGWYQFTLTSKDGEVVGESDKFRRGDVENNPEFWKKIFEESSFTHDVEKRYKMGSAAKLIQGISV